MDVFKNYNNYKQHEGEYSQWKEQRDIDYAKKSEYLKANPISEEEKREAFQKGKALLNAIDVMDEYSQIKAQDAEVATDTVSGQIIGLASMIGSIGGAFLMSVPMVQKSLENLTKKMPKAEKYLIFLPSALGMIVSLVASIPVISWASQAQVGASRRGRFEAMKKDLDSPNQFVVLNETQEEQVKQIAKDIPVDDEMQKHLKNRNMDLNPFGFIKTIKELFSKNKEYDIAQQEFHTQLEKDKNKFDLPLSQKDILNAKKDKQLLSSLVEKIDVASQDYAENVELATNTFNAMAFAGGGLVGWLSDKVFKHIPVKNANIAKMIPWATGLLTALTVSNYAAGIQKQASRIGRFKIKQELSQDVNNFVYVDDEKIQSQPDVEVQKTKKPNFFKFLIQVMKDNKEYKQYLKTEAVEDKKYQKALDKIEFSDTQIKEAKGLQKNTFRTFNKVDENSQKYSESVEAVGQIIQTPISLIGALIGTGLGALLSAKKINSKLMTPDKQMMTQMIYSIGGAFVGILPAIGIDFYTTKEQKKASRVADMMALKELSDYKNFVDYDNLSQNARK